MTDQPTSPQSSIENKTIRAEGFRTYYANNVIVEANAWDMKLVFGQFDEIDGKSALKQQLAVSIPFGLAKLALYWIEAQIIANEIETGRRIGLRESVLPPPVPDLSPGHEKDPNLVKYREAMLQLRERFIASLA